jgi:nucleolar pre-ribosomal-associated protein 1
MHDVLSAFREAAQKLEEDGDSGQWSKRSRDLEREVEKRVPDFMVIIAMAQQKQLLVPTEQGKAKAALLTESVLRLLWLYHKLFPRLIAEVRFDVGKLLMSVVDPAIEATQDVGFDTDRLSTEESQSGLDVLRQLHVLRLLRESDQFVWSSKIGTHTNPSS